MPLVGLLIVPLGLDFIRTFLISPYVASLFIWLNMLFTEMMIFGIGLLLEEIPYSSVSVSRSAQFSSCSTPRSAWRPYSRGWYAAER
ncbi:MAG: hypothetical protein R3B51_11195 [Thermodesulfobacteriota bacterium]